ncbi:MAG: MBL fold metallo-hydrolase [Clostridium sp.]
MKNSIYFMALGGGQRVGASCYFLKLGNDANILLDCGIGYEKGIRFEPKLRALESSPFVESMNEINEVFISHAHIDHIGYLPKLMCICKRSSFYMTKITGLLTEYQLYEKTYLNNLYDNKNIENQRLNLKFNFRRIVELTYSKKVSFNNYTVTYYQAGHIPGAAMMYFEYKNKKILYTGDFSLDDTILTSKCLLPEIVKPDILIMCGLHAKHKGYVKNNNQILKIIEEILSYVKMGKTVYCKVKQLSKGVEFLKYLNMFFNERKLKYKIYLDDNLMRTINKLEEGSIPILSENNYIYEDLCNINKSSIIIGNINIFNKEYKQIDVDFSLHVDFDDIVKFIKKLNPKLAVMVHCGEEKKDNLCTVEQELMRDGDSITQFIFPNEEEIYKLL